MIVFLSSINSNLYALESAVRNVEFNSLPEDRKKELKAFRDFLRK